MTRLTPGAADALQAFRTHAAKHAPLRLGLGKASIDQAGRWPLVIRMTTFKGWRAGLSTFVLEEEEKAPALADRIQKGSQRLQAELAQLLPPERGSVNAATNGLSSAVKLLSNR